MKKQKPKLIIILTDGAWTLREEDKSNIPVIWLINGRLDNISFGDVISV